jgi:hypothetical protein
LSCNLNLNSRRGLETPAFAGKFDFGEEKIVAVVVGGWGDEIVLKPFCHTL